MSDSPAAEHKLSPLHAIHEELGAVFTPFGAWNMPLKYGRELDEHRAVRTAAGIFDLSHMGEVRITGAQAAAFLDYALVSKISAMAVGKAKYSMIVDSQGGILDDLITYRLGDEEFLVVPNAANTDVVVDAFRERAEGFSVEISNESDSTALIALQGPLSQQLLLGLVSTTHYDDITQLRYYASVTIPVAGIDNVLVARTGYTGEDGFELFVPNQQASSLWTAVAHASITVDSEEISPLPCGLAARDSLRLEAAMPLYGNELNRDLTPFDAGLGVLVSKKKDGPFIGDVLLGSSEPDRLLVGLASEQRRAGRHDDTVYLGDKQIGTITSGQPSPTLGHPIALAYISRENATPGTEVEVEIRGKRYPFSIVETPFYRRER